MDSQKRTAVVRAPGRNPGDTPRSGVIHVNVRHTRRFTVVGNHLAQHPEMSLVAIGLAVHIQSLPTGALIGIRDLVPRFPESEYRIAAALRELELHGYLERTRVRLAGGQVVTRTVSYNRPGCPAEAAEPETAPPAPPVTPPTSNPSTPTPAPPSPVSRTPEAREPRQSQEAQEAPEAPQRSAPPRPVNPDNPWRRDAATAVLTDLRHADARLLLGRQDIERLTPAVEAWLERGARPAGILAVLTANLPPQLRNPAGLIAHRLTAQLPPALPDEGPRAPAHVPPDPFQTCEDDACGLAFRSPAPGLCGECRAGTAAA
ncbi:helix-turn-helix domain-containing protein [Streptomyces sp. NPDC059382]|uniref:helix-turn-helix domain-containing protein n=1 Tax=Streptomyces sp. NPDC059382 TaxID=3346816 RepID=UPI0036BDBE6F